jgi:glucose-1-phosphate thymidylyltransferase
MTKVKKALLTGGGRATRLRPITTTINKHLIPLAGKPMIVHAIEKVVEAGVEEIFINTNPGETQIQDTIGNGEKWGVRITYFEQTGGPQGIAHVVKCAEKFMGTDPFIFYLSDNIILGSITSLVENFEKNELDCMLALAEVPDPERFGVPQFDANGNLVDVFEKPHNPTSSLAVTGIYLYNVNFFKAFEHIQKSSRGEYEISDIHSFFLKNNFKVGYKEITGWWKDTGKPNDLLLANKLLLDEFRKENIKKNQEIKNEIEWVDNIQLGKNVNLYKDVVLLAPVMIGDDCVLENCTVGPYVTIGNKTKISEAEIKESIIFGNCAIEAPLKIADSIIGENTKIFKNDVDVFHRFILGDFTQLEF